LEYGDPHHPVRISEELITADLIYWDNQMTKQGQPKDKCGRNFSPQTASSPQVRLSYADTSLRGYPMAYRLKYFAMTLMLLFAQHDL
jgi:hypothetical protein